MKSNAPIPSPPPGRIIADASQLGWLNRGHQYKLAALLCGVLFASPGFAAEPDPPPFRIGFASSMFTDVNENDAKAAVKVWGQMIAREQGVPTSPDPAIFKTIESMLSSLRNREVDAVATTLTEYDALRRDVRFAPIFVTYNAKKTTEQYVLLAHQDSPVKSLADLRGRSLGLHQNPRACLAPLWLDTLLVQEGFKPAAGFAGKITPATKLSKVVLPAFFRQSDACLVARSGFETMAELNPHVGKQLKVIAASPEVVPAVFVFRADYAPPFKDKLLKGVNDLHKTPAGQQVLTIFHSESIEEQPATCLDSALELLATHARLCADTNFAAASGTSVPVARVKGEETE